MPLRCLLLVSIFFSAICFSKVQYQELPQVVRIAIDQTPISFNPFADKHNISEQFKHLLFDPLLRWNKDHQLEKRLVKSWKRIDSKTIRFYLRKSIHFHSGNKLTSSDVIWSFEQAIKEQNSVLLGKIESITRRNRTSFDIRSTLSDSELLDYLTYFFVLDSAFYKNNIGLLETAPPILFPPVKDLPLSGTGPYQVYQYNPVLGVELQANPEYWGGIPEIEHFRFIRINNPQSRLFALLADDVQVSYSIPNHNINDIVESPTKHLVKVPSSNAVFLTVNDKSSSVFKNKNARKGLHLAINQEGMLKHILNGSGRVNLSFMSAAETEFPYTESITMSPPPEYDLRKSKQLLKNIMLPDHVSLLVMLDEAGNTEQVAIALTHMLNKVGIKVVTQEIMSKYTWDKTNLQYDLTISDWHTRLMSINNVYNELFINSFLTGYLQDKFAQEGISHNFNKQSIFFKNLQLNDWVIPLFFQDEIWAESSEFNLEDIFSANGIPYWSLLKFDK